MKTVGQYSIVPVTAILFLASMTIEADSKIAATSSLGIEVKICTLFAENMSNNATKPNVAQTHNSKRLFALGMQHEQLDKLNYDLAFSYYSKAAALGHTKALISLAWMHEHGKSVKHNRKVAITLLQCAANTGDAQAMEDLRLLSNRHRSELLRSRVHHTYQLLVRAFRQQRSQK